VISFMLASLLESFTDGWDCAGVAFYTAAWGNN